MKKFEEIVKEKTEDCEMSDCEISDIIYIDVASSPPRDVPNILEAAKKVYNKVDNRKKLYAPVRGEDAALKMSIANTLGSLPSLIRLFFKEWRKLKWNKKDI